MKEKRLSKRTICLVYAVSFTSILCILAVGGASHAAISNSTGMKEKLDMILRRFPEADTDKDGVLTMEEARVFRSKMKRSKKIDVGKKSAILDQGAAKTARQNVLDSGFSEKRVYKTIGERQLALEIDFPDGWKATDHRPAIVFFQGGGFKSGGTNQFIPQATYFAKRGMVAIRAEYRGTKKDGVLPDKCMEDAISAMRWIRKNASTLGIDSNRIVSSGGSSGGLLAMGVFCLTSLQSPKDDISVSPEPNAIVLYNPGVDFLAEEKFMKLVKGDKTLAEKLSPLRNMRGNMPPTLILYGTEDWLYDQQTKFVEQAKQMNAPIEVFLAEGAEHGFFNTSNWLEKTTERVDDFLSSIGYLEKNAGNIRVPARQEQEQKSAHPPTSSISKSGQLKWRFQTGGAVHPSPDMANGIICFGSLDGYLYGVDAKTGKEVWKFASEKGGIKSSPDIEGNSVYCGAGDGSFYAIDLTKGTILWRFTTGAAIKSSPIVCDGVVYFGAVDGMLYAVEAKTSEVRWKFKTGAIIKSSPFIADGVLFVGSGDNFLYALDVKAGTLKWQFKTGHQIISSPRVSNRVVYFGSSDAFIYAVDATTGQEKWRFKTGNQIISSPCVADEVVYCGSNDGFLYAVDSTTGIEKWKYETGGGIGSSPAIAGGLVIVGSRDDWLYALDRSDGRVVWRFQTDDDITSSPLVLGDTVYFGSMDGNMYAVSTGQVSQSQDSQNMSKPGNIKDKEPRDMNPDAVAIAPTYSDVAYGPHPRNRLDLWQAESKQPTPVLIYFHGGSFKAGDKSSVLKRPVFEGCLKAGISVVSANYRFSTDAPFPSPMLDGARAVQFVRHKARQWNIDPSRVSLSGGSAGGTMALWIALHDDLADSASDDPVLRKSTRVSCLVGYVAPASIEPEYISKHTGAKNAGGGIAQLFGVKKSSELDSPEIRKLIRQASPINHITRDDPPLWLTYHGKMQDAPFPEDTPQKKWIHHVCLGMPLKKIYDELGLECHIYDQAKPAKTGSETGFLRRLLIEQDKNKQ